MDALDIGVLAAVALATSTLSAIAGMAGGIVLLGVMLLYFEPLDAIPLHGVVQLVSNASRVFLQRRHVAWPLVWRYAIPLLPAGGAGLGLARELPAAALRAAIGGFVLLATWADRWLLLGSHPERIRPERRFWLLGTVLGALNVTVGATGPLMAPFFLDLPLGRQGIVGTKAACQACGHLAKIALFGWAGFAFASHLALLAAMTGAGVVGTWLGTRILERMNERLFRWLFRGVLTVIALRLLWNAG
ncbi:MAG: sulfite exporter TauE/SafE family protein [Myxococcota bacterium]